MLTSPTLMILLLKGAAGFNVIIFPAILTGAFKFLEGGGRGVSPGGGTPAIVSGALRGDKGDLRVGGIREGVTVHPIPRPLWPDQHTLEFFLL